MKSPSGQRLYFRIPSERNDEIYREVVDQHLPHSVVAKKYGLTRQRVTAIIRQVREFITIAEGPQRSGLHDEFELQVAYSEALRRIEDDLCDLGKQWRRSTEDLITRKKGYNSRGEYGEAVQRTQTGKVGLMNARLRGHLAKLDVTERLLSKKRLHCEDVLLKEEFPAVRAAIREYDQPRKQRFAAGIRKLEAWTAQKREARLAKEAAAAEAAAAKAAAERGPAEVDAAVVAAENVETAAVFDTACSVASAEIGATSFDTLCAPPTKVVSEAIAAPPVVDGSYWIQTPSLPMFMACVGLLGNGENACAGVAALPAVEPVTVPLLARPAVDAGYPVPTAGQASSGTTFTPSRRGKRPFVPPISKLTGKLIDAPRLQPRAYLIQHGLHPDDYGGGRDKWFEEAAREHYEALLPGTR